MLTENNAQILRITKQYITDMLNGVFFSGTVHWDGVDQFNKTPMLNTEDDQGHKFQQRGILLVHQTIPRALRLLVTVRSESFNSLNRVCYRAIDIPASMTVDDPKRTVYPANNTSLDFSIADTNLGVQQTSSYVFKCNALQGNNEGSLVFGLLDFLLNSDFVMSEDVELFEKLLDEQLSDVPYPGDAHYQQVYAS